MAPKSTNKLSIRLPRDEARELERLAAESRVSVHAILLAQIDPLRENSPGV